MHVFSPSPPLPEIRTVPGLDGSGPGHWQTMWESVLPGCERVHMDDWSQPRRSHWIDQIDRAIAAASGPLVLVAHSLGCLGVAWWARIRWPQVDRRKMLGAMLVAPPDDEACRIAHRIGEFCPAPRETLPFPTILVASRNDPYADFAFSERIADAWGSQFVDAGQTGHINADSSVGLWEPGIALLEALLTSVADAGRTVRSRMDRLRASQPRTFIRGQAA